MEVLRARMAPVFKVEENWKYRREYDNTHVQHVPEGTVKLCASPLREIGQRKSYAVGSHGLAGGSMQPVAHRSLSRMNLEGSNASNSSEGLAEIPQDSFDDPESSQRSDKSGDGEPTKSLSTTAPQKWPIIQIVEPPAWLPECWTAVLRTRESGSKDKYYVDPISQRRFRSKTEVNYFLQTGKSYRYKRNLALLTKPLKEDPVSLPSSSVMRNVSVDLPKARESLQTVPMNRSGVQSRGTIAASGIPSQTEFTRNQISNQKSSLKPKVKMCLGEPSRSISATTPRTIVIEEKKVCLRSEGGLGTENRGKLILKLKRKTGEHDECHENGKKIRPFEVVGAPFMLQGKSKSSICEEAHKHQRSHLATDLSAESISKLRHSVVPFRRTRCGGRGTFLNTSSGQCLLDKTFCCSTLSIAESGNTELVQKRELPAKQLQRLGRKLCQQAVGVLSNDHGGSKTLQQISRGLHAVMSHGLTSVGFNAPVHSAFSPSCNRGCCAPSPSQHRTIKRMRGLLLK